MDNVNNCQICGNEVDIASGGCALMVAFCRNHSTNLSNISVCNDCYDNLVKRHIKGLSDTLGLYWIDVESA